MATEAAGVYADVLSYFERFLADYIKQDDVQRIICFPTFNALVDPVLFAP